MDQSPDPLALFERVSKSCDVAINELDFVGRPSPHDERIREVARVEIDAALAGLRPPG